MRWDFLRFSYYQVLFIIFFHIFALAIKLQVFQWSDRLPETCLQWIMVISNIKYDFFVRILWFFRLKDLLIHVVVFFFYLGFLLRTFTNHRTAEEGGGHFFNSSLPLPLASQTRRHWPGDCCRELTSAHSLQPDPNREPLVSERKSLTTKLGALEEMKRKTQKHWIYFEF